MTYNPEISRRTLLMAAMATGVATPLVARGIAGTAAASVAPSAPAIEKLGESIVTTNMQVEPKPLIQNSSHTHDQIVSYGGWQYAGFYTDAGPDVRHLTVARRRLPDGLWEIATFTDRDQTILDAHRVVNVGVSPRDGTLHLSYDHHQDTITYRRSIQGLLTNPEAHDWTVDKFGPIEHDLSGNPATDVTYPSFVTEANGKLLLAFRTGRHGNLEVPAENWELHEYNGSTGRWKLVSQFLSGEDTGDGRRRPYPNGFTYDATGRLHVTWCWRVAFDANTNHDLMYAYSDDNGRSWRNTAGRRLELPIKLNSPGVRAWEIPPGHRLINQEGQAVDAQGRVHTMMRDDLAGTFQFVHYFLDTDNTWYRRETGIPPAARVKLATDPEGNVYVATGDLRFLAASAAGGYSDWHVIDDTDHGRFEREPLIDHYRAREGVISVSYQELNSPRLIVLDYAIG